MLNLDNHKFKNIIWYVAGSLTTISFIPQIILLFKNFRMKKQNELSLIFITILFISVILWLIYAIIINNKYNKIKKSMIIWNSLSIIFIIIIIYIYKLNSKK